MGTRRRELLQRRIDSATEAAVDTRATVRAAGHAPPVYRPVSSMRVPVPQVRNPPGALGLCRVRVYGLGQRRWLSVIANAARCPTPITNDISNTQVGVEKNQLLELTFPQSLAVSDRFHAVPPLARRWVVLLVIV